MKNQSLNARIDEILREIDEFRRKYMKSLRKSIKNKSVNAKINEFLKEITDVRRKSMKSLRTSMKMDVAKYWMTRWVRRTLSVLPPWLPGVE